MKARLPGIATYTLLLTLSFPWLSARSVVTALAQANTQPALQAIAGSVFDPQGAAIVGASVTLKDSQDRQKSLVTDATGRFKFDGLLPGKYSVRITAPNFAVYEERTINVIAGGDRTVTATLDLEPQTTQITVLSENPLMKGAEYSGGEFILRSEALDLFLQSPGELEAMLRALALRSSGPFGPYLVVNGFEGSPLPPAESIREIRINDNPFSAEYPRLGLGRIEILTKPGTSDLRGQAFLNFGDSNLNTRNPFAENRARYQSRVFGGSVSGPIVLSRSTFFVDASKEETDSNAVINATVLDANTGITPFRRGVVTPERRTSFSPRIDYQLTKENTLVMRYSDTRSYSFNSDVGGFSLESRKRDIATKNRVFQMTETAVLGPRVINEVRFQYVGRRESTQGDNSNPVVNVPGAFIGGGADVGSASDLEKRPELHEVISLGAGRHLLKLGAQARYTKLKNDTTQDFGGTYTFSGRIAPVLTPQGAVVTDSTGDPLTTQITSIEAYRRTIFLSDQGLSPATIRQRGGGASQFTLTAGNSQTDLLQFQGAAFLQDDWRLHPKFSLNLGVRYEYQKSIGQGPNLTPRIAFAWGIDGGKSQPKTVLRGGAGLFYETISPRLVLRARQIDGTRQKQYFVTEDSILDLFPTVPSPSALSGFAIPQSRVQLQRDLRMPETTHASLAIERQFTKEISVAVTYSGLRSRHLLRSRNINAPLNTVRPFPEEANVFQYESSGTSRQQQLLMNLIYRAGKWMTLWSTYTNNHSKSDTDGSDTFPANTFDLGAEYSRSSGEARHTLYWGGWLRMKGGIEFTPLVVWRAGTPFNITTGQDNNGDSLFTDRPAFATDLNRPSVVKTQLGNFDLNPIPGQQIIPRNYGMGPEFFIVNLRASKRFAFNERTSMILSAQGQNLFNRTNPGIPIGNLSSSSFGTSHSAAGDWGFGSNNAGNRRFDLSVFFAF